MILGIGSEARIFLYAFLTGVSILAAYGILECIRLLIRHSYLAAGVEDILFWLGASIYIFAGMYETTYGSIRWFFLLGMACGAMAGWALLRFTVKIYTKLKKALEKYRKSR